MLQLFHELIFIVYNVVWCIFEISEIASFQIVLGQTLECEIVIVISIETMQWSRLF